MCANRVVLLGASDEGNGCADILRANRRKRRDDLFWGIPFRQAGNDHAQRDARSPNDRLTAADRWIANNSILKSRIDRCVLLVLLPGRKIPSCWRMQCYASAIAFARVRSYEHLARMPCVDVLMGTSSLPRCIHADFSNYARCSLATRGVHSAALRRQDLRRPACFARRKYRPVLGEFRERLLSEVAYRAEGPRGAKPDVENPVSKFIFGIRTPISTDNPHERLIVGCKLTAKNVGRVSMHARAPNPLGSRILMRALLVRMNA
jgi:hypothetical protein